MPTRVVETDALGELIRTHVATKHPVHREPRVGALNTARSSASKMNGSGFRLLLLSPLALDRLRDLRAVLPYEASPISGRSHSRPN
jgi:hypothetical protein